MNKVLKILLSIPPVMSLLYSVTFIYPTKFVWLIPNMDVYYAQIWTINGSIYLVLFFLIRRLWKYKSLDRKYKSSWTWLLLFFSTITAFIYIWKKDAEFNEMNLDQKAAKRESEYT
jgi:hypothetical protein